MADTDSFVYFSADNAQRQMLLVSSNLMYDTVTEPSNQPVPQDDHTYSIIDSSQQETIVTSGNPAYAISYRPAAGDKL